MNRELKFRAWDKAERIMTYSNDQDPYCMVSNGDGFSMVYDNSWDENQNNYVYMQYIGLKDKNGKEIYEGDIIRFPKTNGTILVDSIYYRLGRAAFSFKKEPSAPICLSSSYEVIGNIYENPELVEEPSNE